MDAGQKKKLIQLKGRINGESSNELFALLGLVIDIMGEQHRDTKEKLETVLKRRPA